MCGLLPAALGSGCELPRVPLVWLCSSGPCHDTVRGLTVRAYVLKNRRAGQLKSAVTSSDYRPSVSPVRGFGLSDSVTAFSEEMDAFNM